ncbi:MAG: tyrosine-type recombinase/integrase [Thiobacillus sp.]|nr:tyrosine-type recombinase/integrase [Thiobacillus sp.]
MSIKKNRAGWLVDLQPGGRSGKRFRKTLSTKAEALAYEAWLKNKVREAPGWAPAQKDRRKVSELVFTWFNHHGMNLEAGEDAKARMLAMCQAMGEPSISEFGPDMFAIYRANRMAIGIKAETMNREHAYMRAMFNEVKRLGMFKGENPLAGMRRIKSPERELSFLSLEQIGTLLNVLKGDVHLVARVCLATGARWSEAEELRPGQVKGGAIHFTQTKSGKNRSVPIGVELTEGLWAHLVERYGDEAPRAERFFYGCYSAFRYGVKAAGIELPEGQLTHVLRHTFASHFMMNGGNILVLQKILGHASLAMTMRYAHLAPDHLQEAVRLNPLAGIKEA